MTAAADDYTSFLTGLPDPAEHAEVVTPHDANNMTRVSRYLYIGTAGTLTVVTARGETVLFGAVTAGTLLPIRVSRVNATGTTATNIVALA